MGARARHHYTLEVRASREAAGHFMWLIRDYGKLCRGSYRPYPSEAQARAIAEAEMQRLAEPGDAE